MTRGMLEEPNQFLLQAGCSLDMVGLSIFSLKYSAEKPLACAICTSNQQYYPIIIHNTANLRS
jgi:hypothetical protein